MQPVRGSWRNRAAEQGPQLTEPDAVARYSRWLDRLLAVALVGEDAARFCREVAASLPDDG